MMKKSNNCYCDFCRHRLINKPDHNHLVILPDSYDGDYFCFCSMKCAIEYWASQGNLGLSGFHSYAMVQELERQIKMTSFWNISRVNPYQLRLLALKEVERNK